MSQVPDIIKPTFIAPPTALRFDELYSPRPDTVLIGKSEKHYWRTRDRIQFQFYANRENKVVFITCCNMDDRTVYRTIFLDAEVLYFEVECRAQEGYRGKLTRKREKRLFSDEMLHRSVVEYIRARLFITNDQLLWPDFAEPTTSPTTHDAVQHDAAAQPDSVDTGSPMSVEEGVQPPADIPPQVPTGPCEKMCTFNKLSNDLYDKMEINKPPNLSLEGILHTKIVATDYRPPSPPKPVEVPVEVVVAPAPVKSLGRKSSKASNSNMRRPSGAIPAMASSSLPALVPPTSTATGAARSPTATTPSATPVAALLLPSNQSTKCIQELASDLTPLAVTSPDPVTPAPSGSDKVPAKQIVSVTKVKYPPLIKSHSTVPRGPRNTILLKQKPVPKDQVPAAIATAGVATMPSTPAAAPVSAALDTEPPVPAAVATPEPKKKGFPFAAAGARASVMLSRNKKVNQNKVVPV